MNNKIESVRYINLGGTGHMYEVVIDGKCYLFKPGIDKSGKNLEPFRADIQEVGYNIQKIIDPNSAVYCYTDKVKIKDVEIYGALQPRIDTKLFNLDPNNLCTYADICNLKDWQYSDIPLKSNICDQILRETVTDYLLCNFDSHGKNFILGTDDIIRGIDKEQSMRYINEKDCTIDINFSPNRKYGAMEPISHTMLKRYANNTMDFNMLVVYDYIDKVEKINDEDYLAILDKYLYSLQQTQGLSDLQIEKIKREILARKINIRNEFTKVFLNVIEQRSIKDSNNDYCELKEKVISKNK